jgi:hypothetical protein
MPREVYDLSNFKWNPKFRELFIDGFVLGSRYLNSRYYVEGIYIEGMHHTLHFDYVGYDTTMDSWQFNVDKHNCPDATLHDIRVYVKYFTSATMRS